MNFRLLFFLIVSISGQLFAQVTDPKDIYIPKAFLLEKIYLCKYDIITPQELASILNPDYDSLFLSKKPIPEPALHYQLSLDLKHKIANSDKNNSIIENYEAYNLIYYRKLNYEISNLVTKYSKRLKVNILHERDLTENSKTIQFVVKSTNTSEDILKETDYQTSWYIYDQINHVAYKEFPNLESFLKTLTGLTVNCSTNEIEKMSETEVQFYTDKYLPATKSNKTADKKEMSKGAKWTLGILAYAVFQTGIIILSNL